MRVTAATTESGIDRSRPIGWRRWGIRALFLVLVTSMLLIVLASAAGAEVPRPMALESNVNGVLTNIRNWVMGILAMLATVLVTIGGVRYVLSAGDPGEVEKAKTAFKSAAIGYGLAALAPLVVSILKGFVGA